MPHFQVKEFHVHVKNNIFSDKKYPVNLTDYNIAPELARNKISIHD